ncbi:outer membrane protein [Devosia sediminis]|uniref:Outer membrane beta-barrel protein n=1 Tax=Devosia sediminis TaxID=2798801 RepID=A0A934ISQ0_9HYPH|nr:outer membrane beta-barrel protein [Devosia sediminis]MBJ3784461.1 outer membrane beta-barrel protein [Devosia sediminis]
MFVRSLAIGVSAAALMVGGAQAADLIIPVTPEPIYTPAGFDWEGLYVGARVGGQFVGSNVYAGSTTSATYGVIGAAVGVNFIPVDPVLLGVEVTADYNWNHNATSSSEFFANLRVGAVVTDNALVYALGGVGYSTRHNATSEAVYQLGGGVEFAVNDVVTVRGEVVGQGDFSHTAGDAFFESAKATVGVFYHF